MFDIVVSAVVQQEIQNVPEKVKLLFGEILQYAEVAEINESTLLLRDSYIKSKIVTKKSLNDALHVALATTNYCKVIVSWNFKHIVHFEKIPLYNAINILNGHQTISINTPAEVIKYEKE